MVTDLKNKMAEASDAKSAQIQLIKEAVTTILKIENAEYTAPTEGAAKIVSRHAEAKKTIINGINQLRLVEIAPFIKDYVDQTADEPFCAVVLKIMEDKVAALNATLTEEVIDRLALANIQEYTNLQSSNKLNKRALSQLTAEATSIGQMVVALQEMQQYYPAENKPDHKFTLSILQLQNFDEIIISKANEFLASDEKDPQITGALLTLVGNLEDPNISDELTVKLFNQHTNQGKVQYLEDVLDKAAENEDGDSLVRHPILARLGKTYDEVFLETGRAGGVNQLLGNSPSALSKQRALAWD